MTPDYAHDLSGIPEHVEPEPEPEPERVSAERVSAAIAPDPIAEALVREHNRTNYLAFVRAGLPERIGAVLTWLEVQAGFWQQDSGGDPRFPATYARAQAYGDPYTILDDAAARIEFSFVPGDRDMGWRDGMMISAEELTDLLSVLDNQIWILENQPEFATNVACMLRGVVSALIGFRTRTVVGCSKPVDVAASTPAAASTASTTPTTEEA